jgi:hypothetical protein
MSPGDSRHHQVVPKNLTTNLEADQLEYLKR